MPRIAVDIVLLPDQPMTDFVIAANARLIEKFDSPIVLAQNRCLPHISLAMGCIDSEKISSLSQVLEPLVKITPKRLKSARITELLSSAGVISSVQIERSAELQNLHEKICDAAKLFFTFDVIPEMLAGSRADASTLQWISSYFVNSAYENFSPHITIGFGDLGDCELPLDFSASRLAACHLADHCTCAKILWSVEI
jgi:hypothetical protein